MSKDGASNFCPRTLSLLEEVTTSGELKFKSPRIGTVYNSTPEATLLLSADMGQLQSGSRYRNTLKNTAYDSTNPRARVECGKCGRKVVSYQRLGEGKVAHYVCYCGHGWHN